MRRGNGAGWRVRSDLTGVLAVMLLVALTLGGCGVSAHATTAAASATSHQPT